MNSAYRERDIAWSGAAIDYDYRTITCSPLTSSKLRVRTRSTLLST